MYKKIIKIGNYSHTFAIIRGDIADQTTDAIVNAANQNLRLGSGVAGAIRIKGGNLIQQECNKIGRVAVGEAVITTGGNLQARYVIHAVGPIYWQYSHQEAKKLLKMAITNSLKVLEENNLRSITFPAISTGVYGFPKISAAEVIISAIIKYLQFTPLESLEIQLCLFSEKDYDIFLEIAENKILR
jgi:O-acetyl-ADP-ribose deacetylase (regulator of RNase III)